MNFYRYTRNNPVVRTDPRAIKEGVPPSRPIAPPAGPDSPYQGPDGLWYNTLDWNGQTDPTPSLPDPAPTPPPSPEKPSTCPCVHDYNYYAVNATIQSEYDWERVKILSKILLISWALNSVERQLSRELAKDLLKGTDVYLINSDIEDLVKTNRDARKEPEKQLNCSD